MSDIDDIPLGWVGPQKPLYGQHKDGIELPYFDKNGREIKEFSVLKIFHFQGVNSRGNGRKNYYMYKWVRLMEPTPETSRWPGIRFWTAMHLTNGSPDSRVLLYSLSGKDRVIQDCEIVQDYSKS